MKWISIVGARPNFIKIAPFCRAIAAHNRNATAASPIEHLLVHTGQHYDDRMSQAFFTELDIPQADLNLGIGSGTHAEQVGKTMIAFEQVCFEQKPDLVIVVGDVNATLACSVTAKKLGIPVAHIEAGLRSGDHSMPEEINRLVTDSVSDILLAPDHFAVENLLKEGHAEERVHLVGNIMIDTLNRELPKAKALPLPTGLRPNTYAVITLHRPANVDNPAKLSTIVKTILAQADKGQHLFWPIHPRTRARLEGSGLLQALEAHPNLVLSEPLGYHELLRLNTQAQAFLTDSGGLQEECCVLGTPCVTLRDNTERPITLVEHGGTNVLTDLDALPQILDAALKTPCKPFVPSFWDGHTATRMVEILFHGC